MGMSMKGDWILHGVLSTLHGKGKAGMGKGIYRL